MNTLDIQNNTALFVEISKRIIKEQELIIGPIAWEEARKVEGMNVTNGKEGLINVTGDGKQVVDLLVLRYVRLFGKVSQEVCKEAAQDLLLKLPSELVPASLK